MLLDQTARDATFAVLCEQIPGWMKEYRVPGAVVGLMIDGQEYAQAFGVTNVEHPLEVTDQTLFQIGSTTKTVTGTAMMRLAERGDLDLDAPVRRYLPDFKVADDTTSVRVNVRHLITHLTGWPGDVFTDTGNGDDALTLYVAKLADLQQVTPLGELWTYNNAAFVVAGRVIEAVTGKTYESAARELVIEPLGMADSFFFPTEVMVRRFVVGHLPKGEELVIARPWNIPRSSNPAGGLCCTVRDQLRYARFHMGDGLAESGERVLSEASMRLMQTPVVDASNGQKMALSWFIQEAGGVRFVSHGGATFGQMSLFWMAPEKGIALTVMTNGQKGGALNTQVSAWVRKHYLDVVPQEPTPLELTEAELAPYAGRYGQQHSGTMVLTIEGNRLMLQMLPGDLHVLKTKPEVDPPVAVALIESNKLMLLEGPMKGSRGEFLETSDGRRWFRIGVRAYARQDD